MSETIQSSSRVRMRRGVAALLFALLLPVIMGMLALSVDLALIAVARNQLSTAADAAALAGAIKLASENRTRGATNLSVELAAANGQAQSFAQTNSVLNVAPVLVTNPSNADGVGDVKVGYLDPNDSTSSLRSDSAYTTQFNSVQVNLSRNATHVGPVPTFFGGMMGFKGSNVTVQSTATAQNYSIKGFSSTNSSANVNLLPIVLYIDNWRAMMAGSTNDDYAFNPATKTVTSGSDNIHESLIYPIQSGSPGNWGTIKVGVSNNSTSTLGDQIRNGITPAQMATFPSGKIALDPSLSPPSYTFDGNPGISAGIKDDLASIIGKPVIIPIYDTNGGNGNNAWYRVVNFQAVRVMSVNFQGNPKYVIVQPCLVTEPAAIPGVPLPGWSAGGVIRVHLSR
ncbi:Putative Tad-like Flp pilus-assembly [Singulisphaera sp. GP187]|uniref:TadG family pilus assembly protein n=1 Tax=Singulisphaera sp. GP187 TaxID=1882752 RepID=UPI00092B02D4|nr:TadG family pilus assembly protein [Singulisphaera sp. GP187]SIO23916.1 Putative Tad-like Flp pilus-assembly [Singulisphaera sp. GP187]